MKTVFSGLFIASLLMATPALAAKSDVTASNGVKIHINKDEFNEKSEFTSDDIDFGSEAITSWNRSFFIVAARRKDGRPAEDVFIQGATIYRDDWHNYDVATYRGGDPVDATFGDHEVLSCKGGGKCLLSEMFTIHFSKADIEKHARNGMLDIKLGSNSSTEEPVLRIPVEVIDAVREISNR